MSQELLTTQQFAQRTGLSASTISNWLRSGKLQGIKQGRKWMIPADQLPAGRTSSKAPASKEQPKATVKPTPQANSSSYSIAEFAALTYLTELGVQRWLQEKKLAGFRHTDGEWRVYASNLDNHKVSHLLRK